MTGSTDRKKSAKASAGTSLGKAFGILDLFSLSTPLVRIEDIAGELG